MTTRILRPDELDRLAGTALEGVIAYLVPPSAVVAVENDDGAIVACWAVLPTVHVEGLWIDPAARHTLGVARRLWTGMVEVAQALGATRAVITGADSDQVRDLLARKQATRIPCDQYSLPIGDHVWQP